ncbi:MAG: LytR C-terminal domain-containing protein, partial [Candidatus Glassbacteria bacterium]|nr:LytR C-terminal domain-containing protein [Candidatus Glassbacteria bacterium]
FSYTHTLVIGHANSLEAAQVVARRLGCARVSSKPDNLAMVDVTVILGQDWKKFLADSGQDEEPGKWEKLLSKARSILGIE